MPMPPYAVLCSRPGCERPSTFKIAARWSDGITEELKTYDLACTDCLPRLYRASCGKQAACRLAPGEVLEAPGIFALQRGRRDSQLERRRDLEEQFSSQ
jgi:hypothetical protein